ncbi:hypothetical protein Pcinc_026737 [Petrolisthes cinctipes]|uniref:Condensation domain-containing protein n=1 Tax=Petrolisthes cinctipes TaxID=88211 RepID=A0AAE1F6D6_PETCI|nr:hypothetical protein Pcinc_026737 [Petrolisthes cinctipes]
MENGKKDEVGPNNNTNIKFLHPLWVMQNICHSGNANGYYLNVYTYTLCSAAPLQDNHVRQALLCIFRMFPNLRLCFRKREGRVWACQMDREEIDFKVVEGEAHTMTEELGTCTYNNIESDGPMWKARLLKNESNVNSSRKELENDFPHKRTLLIANHHSISDGTSNSQIMECLFQVLNDIIAGKDTNDIKDVAEYKGFDEWQEVIDDYNAKLKNDPEKLNALLEEYSTSSPEGPLFSRFLTLPEDVPYKTRFIETYFDLDTSNRYVKKCKDNGITVNSAILSLINVSFVDFFRESGLELEEYNLTSENTVSTRRYLPKSMSKIVGPHISFCLFNFVTTPRSKNSFWNFAKEVHRNYIEFLEAGDPIIFQCIADRLINGNYVEEFSKPHTSKFDYLTATMGNLDVHQKTDGDHVRLGHLVRFTTNAFEPLMFMYHSHRGRFYLSLSFTDNLVPKETAQKILNLMAENFKSLA